MRAKIAGDARKPLLCTTVLLAVLVGGCADNEPTQPQVQSPEVNAAAAALQAKPGRGIDAEFSRLAREVPGFGGMYYDRAGRLNVYAKGQAGAAARSVDVLGRLRSVAGAQLQGRMAKAGDVVVHAAKYDYTELQGWRSRLTKIFGVKGVVYLDNDESANRLRIGITPAASQAAVVQALARAGVPREAVVFSRISPIKRVVTLRDRIRPPPGGAQLVFPAPSEGPGAFFLCSLGFNAQIVGRPGQRFFVTASHCSDIQGGNQHTPYYQPIPVLSNPNTNKIAVEFKDPNYGNPGGLCDFEGARCRLSDALLAKYIPGVGSDFGKIAKTTFTTQRIGSIQINPASPRFRIIGEFGFPFLGEIAHKVGRTSGWTSGPVIQTCVDVGVTDTDIVQICQDIVFAGVQGGDSGSGVFERAGPSSNDVFLVGVLWGGGTLDGAPVFVFSAMDNIELELGPLNTSAVALASAQ